MIRKNTSEFMRWAALGDYSSAHRNNYWRKRKKCKEIQISIYLILSESNALLDEKENSVSL